MRQLAICTFVAAAVSVAVVVLEDVVEDRAEASESEVADTPGPAPEAASGPAASGGALSYTDALVEDTWVDAARQPGSDRRTLTRASTSVCFLTKIEISGIQGPEDASSCAIEIDDFTGFWQLIATADEGGRSEIRCNARCLNWDARGDEP